MFMMLGNDTANLPTRTESRLTENAQVNALDFDFALVESFGIREFQGTVIL